MSETWIEGWLGKPRFDPYVAACAGNRVRALALYEWNVSLAQALMRDIAHFEVALRNAYDATLTRQWKGSGHWLLDPAPPVVLPMWRVRKDASGLKRGTVTPGRKFHFPSVL